MDTEATLTKMAQLEMVHLETVLEAILAEKALEKGIAGDQLKDVDNIK